MRTYALPKHHVGTPPVSSNALASPLLHALEKGPGDEALFGGKGEMGRAGATALFMILPGV
jgi:hypothetical protein